MKHQIISNSADTAALLRYVTGRYELPFSYRATYWSFTAGFAIVALYLGKELAAWSPATGEDRSALLIGLASTTLFALMFAVRATASYSFTPEAITRESPVWLWRRRLTPAHIHEGWLHLGEGAVLELVTADEARLRIPLEARLRSDFAQLYPEAGHDLRLSQPVASSRIRVIVWVTVSMLVVGVCVLAMILTNAGLTSWR
ncbi:MAG TPA: hypothetical protein VF266_05140 [Thermoanaerobaculia bacterium]